MEHIKAILIKQMPHNSADHHIEMVKENIKEGIWFSPDNYKPFYGLFDICNEWASMGLMAKRITPIWQKGNHHGSRIEFLFKADLYY